MTFKEKLVKLRKLKKITQDEFACAVGVSRQAVYKWESGQSYPEVPKLIEMKHLFGISIDDLLDDNYEVVLPEKKRKRRTAAEMAIAREEEAKARAAKAAARAAKAEAEAAKAAAKAAKAAAAAPVVEAAPAVEETPVVETAPVVPEAPVAEKKGLFGKLFGRK